MGTASQDDWTSRLCRDNWTGNARHLPSCLTSTLLSLLLVFSAGFATAENLNFQHYGIRDGLPQTQVHAIHQDATGYLWVGTFGGLGRYDGREFKVFTIDDGLSNNNVTAITSSNGVVWAGTTSGACYLRPGRDTFECLEKSALGDRHVQVLLADKDNVWVGTEAGLYRIDTHLHVRPIEWNAAQSSDVNALERGPDGALWVGTRNGLLRIAAGKVVETLALPDPGGGQIQALLHDGDRLWIGAVSGLYVLEKGIIAQAKGLPDEWTPDDVNGLALGKDGSLWAATNHGMLWRRAGRFELLMTGDGVMTAINFAVHADREGVIWFGNDDGLSKYVPGPFVSYTEEQGLLHYFVRTINEDSLGRLWLGTRAGAQIVPYIDGTWRFDKSDEITAADGITDERIYSIALPAPQEAYLATGDGVVHWREDVGILRTYSRDDGLPARETRALKLQDDGRLWIGTSLGVRYLQAGEIGTPSHPALAEAYVFRIREDTLGRLWFGTRDHGLFMMGTDGDIKQLGAAEGLTDEAIWDVAPDAKGGVWIGSNGDGLFHIDKHGVIAQYTATDGLIDNFAWQVLVDDKGNVWTYTNRGISRFDGTRFQSYGEDDGLLHLEGGATGAWQSHDGKLWFASANGLMRYDPAREYDNTVPPTVVIQEVTAGNQHIGEGVALPHKGESLNFHYAALSFQSEDQTRYRYRLKGADDEWSNVIPYRPVTYANLGAGDYVFEVVARNPDGVWSVKPAQFRFRVLPPYWATSWFWALVIPAAAFILWVSFRLRVRHMEVRRRGLENLVARRTHELEVVNEQLRIASLIDPLTGLHNRRFLVGQINTDVAQSRRAHRDPGEFPNRDIVFMMVDIDGFKSINDTYGHIAGDRVLRQYAEMLRHEIRESDYIVRWGGEEFLIVARQAEANRSCMIAERIHLKARQKRFEINDEGKTVSCTCSIGISHFPFLPGAPDVFTWEQIVDIADVAVYLAKSNGRDGWVAINATQDAIFKDGANAVGSIRTNMKTLHEAGYLEVRTSFGEAFTLDRGEKRDLNK